MQYRFEATADYEKGITEVEILLNLAITNEENRILFLKLAIVSLVTKFQVFVENILEEFRYELNGALSKNLSTYIKMNSLRLSLESSNPFTGLVKHHNYTEEKKKRVMEYLQSLSYFTEDDYKVDDNFNFSTKFPLGSTGKKELMNLLKQIDGDENPFEEFGEGEFAKLDSVLSMRHSIVHQDRFNGTDSTVRENIDFLQELVIYIDEYLAKKLQSIIDN